MLPSTVLSWYNRTIRKTGYFGSYPDWESARAESTGYDDELILEKVKKALLKVKAGEAVYERDSVIFDKIHYSWPLLAGILWVATQMRGRLSIVDVGGSLGSSYYQNFGFLSHIEALRWCVVEQKNFVACGKQYFEDGILTFSDSLVDELQKDPDLVLLSSVLPYVEKPYELVETILRSRVNFMIIDRTPLLEEEEDRIVVQHVPPEIYPASYPAWILNRQRLIGVLEQSFDLVAEFDALAGRIDLGGMYAYDRGFILRRKSQGENR